MWLNLSMLSDICINSVDMTLVSRQIFSRKTLSVVYFNIFSIDFVYVANIRFLMHSSPKDISTFQIILFFVLYIYFFFQEGPGWGLFCVFANARYFLFVFCHWWFFHWFICVKTFSCCVSFLPLPQIVLQCSLPFKLTSSLCVFFVSSPNPRKYYYIGGI